MRREAAGDGDLYEHDGGDEAPIEEEEAADADESGQQGEDEVPLEVLS